MSAQNATVDDVLATLEAVDWRTVETISTAEAAAWSARLQEAKDSQENGE